MVVPVRCSNPDCGKTYGVDEDRLGQTAVCKHCGQQFILSATARETREPHGETLSGSGSPAASEVEMPKKLGRFEIRARIGSGAFGTVYWAHDPVLDRDVALKVPRAAVLEKPQARARFLREPKAAAQLRHPHIVPVYDAGTDGEHYYIASAYIEGHTLQHVIEQERPDFRRAAEIVRGLADALHYAHRMGVVHRDVKPANVMIDRQGQALLMDFGLARLESSEEKLTQDGSLMGTPAYMAPEQADGSLGEVGPASDQYGLGVVLYEALCRQTPFSGPPSVLIFNAIHQEPPAPSSLDPEIPRDLETICLKAMAKRAGERYANCGAMADDLRRWLAGKPIRARRVGPVERAVGWCRRNRALAALSVVSLVLLLTVAVMVIGRRNAKPVPFSGEEIPQFYEFINDAWARSDLAGIAGRVSEEGAAMVLDIGGEERLVDAQGYRKLIQNWDLARSGIASHVVRPVKVVQYGDSATVWTRTDERLKDGQERSMRAFQVLGRYGSGWRIVLHLPDLADFVVEITEVLPDSQAQRVGLRVGDQLVSYAGEPINNPEDLVRLTKLKTSDRGIPLVVRRGDQELSLNVDGGELGVRPTGLIVPKEETATSGPEVEAIAHMYGELSAAVRERGVTAQKEFFYDAAIALVADPNPGVLSGDELVRALDGDLPNADPGSFRFTEVRVLVSGRVALGQTTNWMLLKSGQEFSSPAIHGLFKENGRWRIFAAIPPYFTIHPDVPAQLAAEPPAQPLNEPNAQAGGSAGIDEPVPP